MPRDRDKGYPLPVPVDDGTRLCVIVRIPNIPGYRQAFINAVNTLVHPSVWARDDAHTASLVAGVWRGVFSEMMETFYDQECGDMVQKCCEQDISYHIIKRVNPTTGRPEVSDDDGGTWHPDPDDGINSIQSLPPPVTAGISATACDAAKNGAIHIGELIDGTSVWLADALTVFELAVGIIGLALEIALTIFSGGLAAWATVPQIIMLAGLIWAAATALFAMGQAAFDAYWGEEERDKILCALACTIGEDGSFSEAQFESFMRKWKADGTPSVALNMLTQSVRALGRKGLNQYCAYGDSVGTDCSDCACENCANIDEWEDLNPATLGEIIDRDDQSLTVEGKWDADRGMYTAMSMNHSAGFDHCCIIDMVENVVGARNGTWALSACGNEPRNDNMLSSGFEGTPLNGFRFHSPAPFTIKVTFIPD